MRWADVRALESLRTGRIPPETLAIYGHVLGAEHVWLARLEQKPPSLVVWPSLTLEECAEASARNDSNYRAFLDELTEAGLQHEVPYTNSAGQSFRSRVDDILLHVAMHGSYHRGQIASQVRRAGGTPAPTDYIGFVRGVPAAVTPR
jgi:uncharacterized damage-inducible protein DinB